MLTKTPPLRLQLSALALASAGVWPVWAQTRPPGAGELLEEMRRPAPPALPSQTPPRLIEAPVRPTINMPDGAAVTVTEFRITGAVSFAPDVLAALVQPWIGKRLDIRGLNEAAGALTRHYQTNGHLLSYAYLPAQRVADGVIELAVLEGKLEGVQIVTAQDVRLRDQVIQAHTDPLIAPGPLLQSDVERKLLLLNDMPGVAARAAFTPGATTGGAEMVVSVAEDDPLEVRTEFSNHGSLSTGQYQAGLQLHFRDLFGWGDSTSARGLLSNRGDLVTGNLSTTVPVGGDGWKLGASLSRLTYQLAGDFRRLGAVGQADSVGADASFPLRRTADSNINLKGGFEISRLRDELQLLGTANARRNDTADIGANFDHRDTIGGVSAGSATATLGFLRLAGTKEEWHRLSVQAARLQNITGPWSVYARLAAQKTGSTLDSSEKLGLAGANGVRAYALGEVSVDQGVLASLELRYALDFLGGNVVGSFFHDYGGGTVNRGIGSNLPGNDPELNGTGFGLSWSSGGLGLNASLAWRGSRVPTTDTNDPRPRLFFQMFYTP